MKLFALCICVLMIFGSIRWFSSATPSASIVKTYLPPISKQPQFDVGPAKFAFGASKFSWANGPYNTTMLLSTLAVVVAGVKCTVPLSTTFSNNATVYTWSFVGAVAVCNGVGLSSTLKLYVKNTTVYNSLEIIAVASTTQTLGLLSLTTQITFPLVTPSATSCGPGCTSVNNGATSFDFSSVSSISIWSDATKTLTCASAAAVSTTQTLKCDPLAVDGNVRASCSSPGQNSCTTPTLTVTKANDILYLTTVEAPPPTGADVSTGTAQCLAATTCAASAITTTWGGEVIVAYCSAKTATSTFKAPTDTASLVWTQKGSTFQAQGESLSEWWAATGGTVTSTISCNISTAATTLNINVVSYSGINLVSPFDSNGNLPNTASGTGTSATCTISTSNAVDVLTGYWVGTTTGTATAPSGWTQTNSVGTTPISKTALQLVVSTQSAVSETWTVSGVITGWALVCNALQANSGSVSVSSITSSPALTWIQRAFVNLPSVTSVSSTTMDCTASLQCEQETWAALSTSVFSGTVTVTVGGSSVCCIERLIVFGISGAYTAGGIEQAFDQQSSIPCTGTATSGTVSCTVTTSNPDDIALGLIAQFSSTCTAGTGFTRIQFSLGTNPNTCAEDEVLSAIQSGFSINYAAPTCSASIVCSIIGDAVTGDSPTVSVQQPNLLGVFLIAGLGLALFVFISRRKR